MSTTSTLRVILSLTLASLAGCAATPSSPDPMDEANENAIVHQATEADLAAARSKAPLAADSAVLYVNGLGCPLCASNIDKQLLRLRGVKSADVDLSTGIVTVALVGETRPSPSSLAAAVEDAGFTLVKIQTR